MNKVVSVIITLGLVVAIGIIFFGGSKNSEGEALGQVLQHVEIRDGVQYVTIAAKGGYSPQFSTAQAGIPTKLILTTNGTYDCSSSVVIRSIGYQKVLPQTGEEVIDVGALEAGTLLQGTCSMGMYTFSVAFN